MQKDQGTYSAEILRPWFGAGCISDLPSDSLDLVFIILYNLTEIMLVLYKRVP